MNKVHSASDKSLSCMSLRISTAAQLKHHHASILQVCRPAQEMPTPSDPSGAMHFVVEHHQKAEVSGGFDQNASRDSKKLDVQFSEDAKSEVDTALLCLGGERGALLSHASSSLRLQPGRHTAGEMWRIIPDPQDCTFTIMCLGQEEGLFLAHFHGEVYLTPNSCERSSLQWHVEKHQDDYKVACYSKSSWMNLSHACGKVFLQWAFLGAGEL